jgi:hypothetical protein
VVATSMAPSTIVAVANLRQIMKLSNILAPSASSPI